MCTMCSDARKFLGAYNCIDLVIFRVLQVTVLPLLALLRFVYWGSRASN